MVHNYNQRCVVFNYTTVHLKILTDEDLLLNGNFNLTGGRLFYFLFIFH